jgi:hypothetical protein
MATAQRTRPSGTRAKRPSRTGRSTARNVDGIDRIERSLEAAQKGLASIRGDLRTGSRDLVKDVDRLLRDARRDVGKLGRALRRDLEKLQADMSKPPKTSVRPRAARSPQGRSQARR